MYLLNGWWSELQGHWITGIHVVSLTAARVREALPASELIKAGFIAMVTTVVTTVVTTAVTVAVLTERIEGVRTEFRQGVENIKSERRTIIESRNKEIAGIEKEIAEIKRRLALIEDGVKELQKGINQPRR